MDGKYQILGINDDKDFCCCCGKQGLKRVVWLQNNNTSEVNHFGVHCAALLLCPNIKSGKISIIEREAIDSLKKIVDSLADKYWGTTPYRSFVCKIGKDLVDMGVESRFDFISAKTDAFCNFIWPYQKDANRAIELNMTIDQYHNYVKNGN